jgi:hypothetical protein
VANVEDDRPDPEKSKPHDEPAPQEPAAEEPVSEFGDLLSGDVLAGLEAMNVDEVAAATPAEEPVVGEGAETKSEVAGEGLLEGISEGFAAQAAAEAAKEPPAEEAKEEEGKEKKPRQREKYLELAAMIGVPLVVLGIAGLCAMFFTTAFGAFSTAVYLIALASIPFGIWKGRETSTVYTMILGGALAFILTGAFYLWLEIGRYNGDIRARSAKQHGAVAQVFEPAHTTLAAWPALPLQSFLS